MASNPERRSSEIAPDTLVIASVGSASATVVIGRFGLAGTILGAALFPVVLALAKELARRPTRTLPDVVRRRRRAVLGRADVTGAEQGAAPLRDRLAGVRWRRVLATAASAFAVVAAAFTLAELAFGTSLVSDRPTTFFSPEREPAPPADDSDAPTPAEEGPEDEAPPPEEPEEQPEEPAPADVPPPEEPPAEELP